MPSVRDEGGSDPLPHAVAPKQMLAPQLSKIPKFCVGHQFQNGKKHAGFRAFGGDKDAWERITEMRGREGELEIPQPPPAPLPFFFSFTIKFTVYQLNTDVWRSGP